MRNWVSTLIFLWSVLSADAQLRVERVWTGGNGRTFVGTFHQMTEGGLKAEFVTTDGKVMTVALENLIPGDREMILDSTREKTEEQVKPGGIVGFKPGATPDRTTIPLLVPKSFGGETGESLVDALWISMLWWDVANVLKVPTNGDLEDKAEWLHEKLIKAVASGAGNVNAEDAKAGVAKYFSEELGSTAACRVSIEHRDFTATRLSRLAQGENVVVLRMSMSYENGRDYSASVALESMTEDGKFVMILAGKRLSGQVRPIEEGSSAPPGSVPSEYVLDNPSELAELYKRNRARFFMGKASWNASILLKPYVYLTPGVPSPLPTEDAPPPSGGESGPSSEVPPPDRSVVMAPKGEREVSPKFPIRFVNPVSSIHECAMGDGRMVRGSVVSRGSGLVSLKVPTGETVSVPTRLMTEEEIGKIFFWDASRGGPINIPRLDLSYQLVTSRSGNFDFNITTEGSLGRIEVLTKWYKFVLVFDLKDGAFVSSSFPNSNPKEATRIRIGRFQPKNLRPMGTESRLTQKEIDEYLKNVLPLAPQAEPAAVPCRRIPFPLATNTEAFRNPEIDFVLSDQPVVITALFQLLCGATAGEEGTQYFVFTPMEVPQRRESESFFPMLAACRMLPVRMAWENLPNERHTPVESRMKEAGRFSIELKRVTVPASFPPGHFAILPGARAMAAGMSTSKEFKK